MPGRKRRATRGQKYKHDYTRFGTSKTWALADAETRATIRRIDSVNGGRSPEDTPDYQSSIGVAKCTGYTCARCEDWKQVYWVRAWSVASKVAPGQTPTCTNDLCVAECVTCGNILEFWRSSTVKRSVTTVWDQGDPDAGIPGVVRELVSYTGVLEYPGTRRIP